MEPVDDLPLRPSASLAPSSPPGRAPRAFVGIAIAIILVVAAAGVFMWRRAPATAPPFVQRGSPAAVGDARSRAPLGPAVEATALPALDVSDPLVRDLLGRLSSRPEVTAWLASTDLIRHFVASLDAVASGATPARQLPALAPRDRFQIVRRGDTVLVGPGAYERYTGVAGTLTSLDPADLARLYATLKPRLADAYRELGHPDGNIDGAVEQALVRLLETPVPRLPIELKPGTVSYRFADDRLEELSAAQKQLLRMGPTNQRAVQRHLWALGRELGIPAERLPAPSGR